MPPAITALAEISRADGPGPGGAASSSRPASRPVAARLVGPARLVGRPPELGLVDGLATGLGGRVSHRLGPPAGAGNGGGGRAGPGPGQLGDSRRRVRRRGGGQDRREQHGVGRRCGLGLRARSLATVRIRSAVLPISTTPGPERDQPAGGPVLGDLHLQLDGLADPALGLGQQLGGHRHDAVGPRGHLGVDGDAVLGADQRQLDRLDGQPPVVVGGEDQPGVDRVAVGVGPARAGVLRTVIGNTTPSWSMVLTLGRLRISTPC